MAKPVLVIVDDEDASRHALARELESRYGAHYRIVALPSAEMALARLAGFRDEGVAVPLVLADHWMTGMTGTEFLARVKDIVPTARPGRAPGSGTTSDSRAASAERTWPGGPTSKPGRSARTSSTATRPPRWPPGKTCTWWA
jgi:CheY-like chemotaxis protein